MQLSHKSSFYLLDKPKTWTSQDLCTKLKKNFKFKKVGHSGTLDPNADGLMLLATNGYTKLFDYIDNTNKTYKVTAILGYSSPTLDVDSDITKHDDINADHLKPQIQEFLNKLVGESTQTPPIYSAIKVKGKRLYKYARQNQDVEIPDRKIYVESTELLEVMDNKVTFEISVSKGTYIRSIVQQLGEYVKTYAIVDTLTRTAVGNLNINHKSLNTNVEDLNYNSKIKSIDWEEIINLPKIELDIEMNETIKNGQLLPRNMFSKEENYIISIENNIVAIYKPFNEKHYKPEKVLV
jgi:tRNA pseudouridine55 synthase